MLKLFCHTCILMGCLFLLISCNDVQGDERQRKKYLEDYRLILKHNLKGKWGGLGENTPVWDIREDSVFYFDRAKSYAYEMLGPDLIIHYENGLVVLKNIRVKVDTLFFVEQDSGLPTTAYRFK